MTWLKACAESACVEVHLPDSVAGHVHVRNSQTPSQWLQFTREEWAAFLDGVRAGTFDLPESGRPAGS